MTVSETFSHVPRFSGVRNASALPWMAIVATALIHVAALLSIFQTEYGLLATTLALLTWAFLNFFWLAVLRRPAASAALSLAIIETLMVLSQFKFNILEMAISFFDFLIVDADTARFLLMIFPELRNTIIAAVAVGIPLIIVLWRVDPLRIRCSIATIAGAASLAGMMVFAGAVPEQSWEPFQGVNHISNFVRSGVLSVSELVTHGWLEADAAATNELQSALFSTCKPATKPPNIIMLLDESSFDITASPSIKVPPGYRRHFRSFDGKERSLLVEATGGPTWYAEYNVLGGLSARSYGRFMFNVTRIAAGRVRRGLPQALRWCGYKTFTLYPANGDFLSARRFQEGVGIEHFVDMKAMGISSDLQPDRFYLDQARRMIESEHGERPLFIFVYVAVNHFPWTWTFRPDLTPDWRPLGNSPEIDEYIRRQSMSADDYSDFLVKLREDFPTESFLLLRFGDHQPAISIKALDPDADAATIVDRLMTYDPRYFTTYYAIDAVNFSPVDVSSALDRLDAPYLPLVLLEAAGLPLDASFAEQKKILKRCGGLFYRCNAGAEARRFNRLLLDAGLIKGL
jgi:hypothetical protein